MTARHIGYVVRLASDIREDDSQAVIAAILQLRGVAAVEPVEATFDATVMASRRRDEWWRGKLNDLVRGSW